MKHIVVGVVLCYCAGAGAAPAVARPVGAASLPATAMLAEKGDPAALLRLGEMYWYGDGAPLDRVRGDAMFARAAAAGSKEAVAALTLSRKRQQHLAAIDWWTGEYAGADLTAGKFSCAIPVIPQRSSSVQDAEAVDAAYEKYRVCYNGFIDQLYSASPPSSRIPADVALVMSESEFNLASDRLDGIYASLKARAQAEAAQVAAARSKWASDSVAYLTTHALRRQQYIMEAEARSRAYGQFLQDNIRPDPKPPANVTGR